MARHCRDQGSVAFQLSALLKPVKPLLTVMLRPSQMENVIEMHGVSEDVTIFRKQFAGELVPALRYLVDTYQRSYRVVLNIPPTIRRER